MFGFGNKKRIEELERQVEILVNSYGDLRNEKLDSWAERMVNRPPCKCGSCHIKTTGETSEMFQRPSGFGAIDIKVPIFISAAKAIEKIMDHLGLEFDHIDAKPSDTVIKPKETP